jgi:branched-chain amino acid transport system ATP-binding protein
MAVLTIDGLTASYGDIRVLTNVSCSVAAGSVTAVLGRNGAGKTSLLNCIAGLPPRISAGRVLFDGHDIAGISPDRRVRGGLAYVQEGKRVFSSRTVEENLLLGAFTIGTPLRLRTSAVRAALARAYDQFPMLAERRRSPAGRLSGGQQQMLAIAQALMPEPRVLLLDEPSAGLAPAVWKEVFETVSTLRRNGLAVLLVEQVVEPVLGIADRVLILGEGRVMADGVTNDFREAAVVREVYFAKDAVPDINGNQGVDAGKGVGSQPAELPPGQQITQAPGAGGK